MEDKVRLNSGRTFRLVLMVFAAAIVALQPLPARGDGIRIKSLADARLALEDRDNRINPYDFGRNPAWLLQDFDFRYLRLSGSLYEISGDLRRDFDPHLVNDLYIGVEGIKLLSDRQVVRGYIDYQRLRNREVFRNLETDQYNDPFYLNDETTGDFDYYGPRTSVDWAIRLTDRLYFGAGFDYDINTGLKQVYTRPEIVHNYFQGIFGLTWQPAGKWVLGVAYRPARLQNRTQFARPDEGFDNVIQGYSGDGIFEIRSFSSYTITDIEISHHVDLQGFYLGEDITAGVTARGGISENEVKYSATRQFSKGYWKEELVDVDFRARYAPSAKPLALGISARYLSNDGWGIRPDFEEVLLYDNPYSMYSAGIGLAYRFAPIDMMILGEYIYKKYDIEVYDNGASLYRKADHTSNIGRVALEKNISNIYSFRAGYEYIDYPIDRWIKLPRNIDASRITAGFDAYVGGWNVAMHLEYGLGKQEETDAERQQLGAVLWFTKYIN